MPAHRIAVVQLRIGKMSSATDLTAPAPIIEPTSPQSSGQNWTAALPPPEIMGPSPMKASPSNRGTKRNVEVSPQPATGDGRRVSARKQRQIEQHEEPAAPSTSAPASTAASAAPSPLGQGNYMGPFSSGQPSSSLSSSTSASPSKAKWPPAERKIWMRACNECGHELHVRRTKCTECGTVQVSKRSVQMAEQEWQRAEELKAEAAAEAEAELELRAEAQTAASQLAAIADTQRSSAMTSSALTLLAAAPLCDDACAAAAPSSAPVSPDQQLKMLQEQAVLSAAATAAEGVGVGRHDSAEADAAPSEASTASASASASANARLVGALARLTPEQLLKVRRMHKLKALLTRLPEGTQPPRSRTAPQQPEAPPAPATDAIAMLASMAMLASR